MTPMMDEMLENWLKVIWTHVRRPLEALARRVDYMVFNP